MYVKRNTLKVDIDKIREVMEIRGMSVPSVAKALGKTTQGIWHRLNRAIPCHMQIYEINEFARVLNWNATDFLVVDYIDRDIVEEIAERNVYRRKVDQSESQA